MYAILSYVNPVKLNKLIDDVNRKVTELKAKGAVIHDIIIMPDCIDTELPCYENSAVAVKIIYSMH